MSQGGGPHAYAFLTEPCLQRMPASFGLPSHSESCESFGQITGGVHDLAAQEGLDEDAATEK